MQVSNDWYLNEELVKLRREWIKAEEAASGAVEASGGSSEGLSAEGQELVRRAVEAHDAYVALSIKLRGYANAE
ncbi:hypothetical protein [Sphaerisporangium rhizosphaerae]|uniref:Uncharacterized protein n=1 Tax=Sphaerisporangium rhizosphaerae TaxID=2269375 RepID=A0ABW2NYC9_9ACTN